jgi:hypothetical protein
VSSSTWCEMAVLATRSLRLKRADLRLSKSKVAQDTDSGPTSDGPTLPVTPWRLRLLLEATTESSEGRETSKRRSLMLETVLLLPIRTEKR